MEKQSRQSSLGVDREGGVESGVKAKGSKLVSDTCLLSSNGLRQTTFFDT